MAAHVVDVRILLKRVETLLRQLQYDEALSVAREVVVLAPLSWEGWRELAAACSHLGRVQEMEDAFEQALRLAPTPWDEMETWCARGNAENDANAWEAALRSFARVTELEPEWYFPWLMRGLVLGNMGTFIDRRYHEEALVALDQALVALDQALTRKGLHTVDKRVAYSLKAKSLSCLGRREEAEMCGWKAQALYQLERAAADAAHQPH